jgi:hypothetical protein
VPAIASVDELMAYLDVGGSNPARVNNTALTLSLESAERWVENYTGRLFRPDPALVSGVDSAPPVLKTFNWDTRGYGWLRIPDLRSATGVSIDGIVFEEGSDYIFDIAPAFEEPYTMIRFPFFSTTTNPYTASVVPLVAITGRWGFWPAPADVKDAVLSLAARQYRRRDAMFSDIVDVGTGIYEYRAGIPAHIREILKGYKMPLVALV